MTVWRDAQQAGEVLRTTRPRGRIQVLGVDETVYRVKGKETIIGMVTDGQRGLTLDFDVLEATDSAAFERWLAPYVRQYGVEVLVSDEHGSYGVVAAHLGLEQQLCRAQRAPNVRKALTKRGKAILAQARQTRFDERQIERLASELAQIRTLIRELPATGSRDLEELHRRYLYAAPPRKDEQASVAYRMRILTLELWEHWSKLRLHLERPELRLDGTNNGTERAIGKSKIRYKTMRGYKSLNGLCNGIALTQWLYSGAEHHDLAAAMAT